MGKPDQGSAAAEESPDGDRRRRRARPWRPIVSGAEARSGAAAVARGGSRVGVAGGGNHRGAGLAVARPVSGRWPGQPEEPGAGCPERRRSSAYLCILPPDGTPSRLRARWPPPTAVPSCPGTMCHCARGERTARQSFSYRTIFGYLSRSSRTRVERIEALPVAQLDRCDAHAERAVVTGVGDMCIARQ